jgi:hypothetical protein
MKRSLLAIPLTALLTLVLVAPVGAKEFGTIYAEGDTYRTFGNSARVDPGTGTDRIVGFTNFDQFNVAEFAPGTGSHGGRWAVYMATWVDEDEAHLLTHFDDVLALIDSGDLTWMRVPGADFRCPILPNG